MFEALTLGVFEAGLSWSIGFAKRDAFPAACRDFDVVRVAAITSGMGRRRERARDEVRIAEACRAREVLRDRPQACRRAPSLATRLALTAPTRLASMAAPPRAYDCGSLA